jgi:ZIP family zinc transporter
MNLYVAPIVSLVTTLLGIGILVFSQTSLAQRWTSLILGACAGIMLGASFFSLINPAVHMTAMLDVLPPALLDNLAIILGAGLMLAIHEFTPHVHSSKGPEGMRAVSKEHRSQRSVILITTAVALHNVPEGFALGVGTQSTEAMALLWGIGIQNIPEGAIIAMSVKALSQNNRLAIIATVAAAVMEALSAYVGGVLGSSTEIVTRYALLFCAGAMIYVVSQEMIPESHRGGEEGIATMALIMGVVLMLGLSVSMA